MTCTDCLAATETKGLWTRFNSPQCIFCAARLIKQIGTLRTPASAEITARRRVVLQIAIDYGHSETEIRELVKSGPWVVPVETKKRG